MKKKLQWDESLIRPLIYQVFTRFIIFLFIVELAAFFLTSRLGNVREIGFVLTGFFCLVMAWMAWLRLDGLKVAKFDRKLFQRRKKPTRGLGDMIDYVDEPITTFDDLDDREKDTVLLISNLITFALLMVMAVVRK